MRCQPGDLAVITYSEWPENIGAMVEVLSPCDIPGHDWWVRGRRELSGCESPGVGAMVDRFLLPIRPQSDEATETEDELETVTE